MKKLLERLQRLQYTVDSDPSPEAELMDELYELQLEALSFLQEQKEWAIGVNFVLGMPIVDIPSTDVIFNGDSTIIVVEDDDDLEVKVVPILHLMQIIEDEKHQEPEVFFKGMEGDVIFHFPTERGPIPVLFRESLYARDKSLAWEVYFPEGVTSFNVTNKGVHALSSPIVSYGMVFWRGEKFKREESLPELIESIYRLQRGGFYGMKEFPVDEKGHLSVLNNSSPSPRKWRG